MTTEAFCERCDAPTDGRHRYCRRCSEKVNSEARRRMRFDETEPLHTHICISIEHDVDLTAEQWQAVCESYRNAVNEIATEIQARDAMAVINRDGETLARVGDLGIVAPGFPP